METTTNTIHQKYRTSKWKTKTSPSIRDKISSPRATFGNAKITGVLSFSFPESSFNYTKKAQPYSLFQYPQTLSLSLLTNPNLFLQEYSIPSIQATGLFFNSIFFQFKIHVFVSCTLYRLLNSSNF